MNEVLESRLTCANAISVDSRGNGGLQEDREHKVLLVRVGFIPVSNRFLVWYS